jgi:hypothetical protein
MTTSGVYTFDPSLAALVDEASERAGIDPAKISARHIRSAKMSMNLMLTEWAVRDGDCAYRVDRLTSTVASGTNYFDPATGVFDIVDVTVEYNNSGTDIPMTRIGGQEYLNIADKTVTGQPAQYWVDQSNTSAPRVYLWPVPDASVDLTYDVMRYTQTLRTLADTLDINRLWLEAVAAGLALRLAEKYNQARVPYLSTRAEESYRMARAGSKGRADVLIGARGFGHSMRRRRT